jgi:hypothetical protein
MGKVVQYTLVVSACSRLHSHLLLRHASRFSITSSKLPVNTNTLKFRGKPLSGRRQGTVSGEAFGVVVG